jgi:hypothetical protein
MNVCGICGRSPRPGEGSNRIRLAVEDMADKKYPMPKTPGLYQCCKDCFEEYLPIAAKRLGHTVESIPHDHCV